MTAHEAQEREIISLMLEELKNSFRRNDMDVQSAETTGQPKAFEQVVKALTKCSEVAVRLSKRSKKLVSSYTEGNEPCVDKKDTDQKVASVVLVHVLRDVENELAKSLSEISDNLTKLENAW